MTIFPAIDLFEGRVVRLTEGDFRRRSDYETTPLDAAKSFLDAGCRHIHIVDLEGAKLGHPCHLKVLEEIASLGMFIQYGGGLRSAESVREAVKCGADRVMIGSLLFKNPESAPLMASELGCAAMAAIDVRNGKVVHSGWLEGTELSAKEAIRKLKSDGLSVFLVTDTERDGKMSGCRAEFYASLAEENCEIVAAGGITTCDDIIALAQAKVSGAVVGKSLYEGGVTPAEALAAGRMFE